MKKEKFRKPLHDSKHKIPPQFVDDVYFNPKERKEIRRLFVDLKVGCQKILTKPLKPNPSSEELYYRHYAEESVAQAGKMVDLIDHTVPKKLKEFQLINCFFKLFKKPNSNFLVIEYRYDKGVSKKHFRSHLLIPSGFPKKGFRTSVQMIRGNYDLKGFDQIDEGILLKLKKVS